MPDVPRDSSWIDFCSGARSKALSFRPFCEFQRLVCSYLTYAGEASFNYSLLGHKPQTNHGDLAGVIACHLTHLSNHVTGHVTWCHMCQLSCCRRLPAPVPPYRTTASGGRGPRGSRERAWFFSHTLRTGGRHRWPQNLARIDGGGVRQ